MPTPQENAIHLIKYYVTFCVIAYTTQYIEFWDYLEILSRGMRLVFHFIRLTFCTSVMSRSLSFTSSSTGTHETPLVFNLTRSSTPFNCFNFCQSICSSPSIYVSIRSAIEGVVIYGVDLSRTSLFVRFISIRAVRLSYIITGDALFISPRIETFSL